MGSSKYPKTSGLPKQIFPSQDDSSELEVLTGGELQAGFNSENTLSEITFYLVQIDPEVYSLAKVDDPIWIDIGKDIQQVMTSKGRIGNVPYHKLNAIKLYRFSRGTILKLNGSQKKVKVKFEADL